VVSGKGDLKGKMAMFGGFLRNVPHKFGTFCVGVCNSLLKDQSDTSYAVSQLEFFSKIYRVSRCGCLMSERAYTQAS